MSDVHEAAVPRLHLSLRETRAELRAIRELAAELAVALDHEVDARHAEQPPNVRETAHALLRARMAGLL